MLCFDLLFDGVESFTLWEVSVNWEFINSFAPWFSAIGTLVAASVALYLGVSVRAEKLNLFGGIRLLVGDGEATEWVVVKVTNVGHASLIVTGFGWRVGLFKKQHFFQKPGSSMSDQFPKRLDPGEEAQVVVAMSDYVNYVDSFFYGPISKALPSIYMRTLEVGAFTSRGKGVYRPVEGGLKKRLIEAYKGNG